MLQREEGSENREASILIQLHEKKWGLNLVESGMYFAHTLLQ